MANLTGIVSGTENTEETWDEEYDVVVLGFGGAGANAAVAAYEQGATVLLAEKAPEGSEGGNTAVSGQFVMATDDPDGLYDYLTTLMGKFQNWDPEAVRAYCEGCAENYNWMTGPMGGDPAIISPTELLFTASIFSIVSSGVISRLPRSVALPKACIRASGCSFESR